MRLVYSQFDFWENVKMRVSFLCMALVVASSAFADPPPAGMVQPQYTEDGNLIRPAGFREWIYAGSSMGLSYQETRREGPGVFHHVYIQPEAYRHYRDTGVFPEKTMLVMENFSAGSKEDNTAKGRVEGREEFEILNGHFEDQRVGLEVAVKDSGQFEDGWAYFMFALPNMPLRESAKAFPKAACWDCHDSHAADDNVFIQFYPVLREHYEKRNGLTDMKEATDD